MAPICLAKDFRVNELQESNFNDEWNNYGTRLIYKRSLFKP